jgi:hypothetical protein
MAKKSTICQIIRDEIEAFVSMEEDQSSTSPFVELSEQEKQTISQLFAKSNKMADSARIYLKKRLILSLLFQLLHGLYMSKQIMDFEHELMYSFCISLAKCLEKEFILKCPTMTPQSCKKLYSDLMADQLEDIRRSNFTICSWKLYYDQLNNFFGTQMNIIPENEE